MNEQKLDENAALHFRAYLRQGYYRPDGKAKAVAAYLEEYEALQATVLEERDSSGELIGTVMCSATGVTAADKIFPEKMADARRKFKKVGYVCKFAVDPALQGEEVGLLLLAQVVMTWAPNEDLDALTLIVNPAHKNFYCSIGGEEAGYTAGYDGLEKAPGVLVVIDLSTAQARISRAYRLLQARLKRQSPKAETRTA